MKRLYLLYLCLAYCFTATAQHKVPKLVIGIVIDQMRWDFLYRFQGRYLPDGGFEKLRTQGYQLHHTLIPYIPTSTACGHATAYTGATPAYHGIVGNSWWDKKTRKKITSVSSANYGQSPERLEVTTVGDELKRAYNFKSRVYSISFKDRAAILPGGYAADMAFWWDGKKGNWTTSAYYADSLPQWVKDFKAREKTDAYYKEGWRPLYPLSTYTRSRPDSSRHEAGIIRPEQSWFNYDLKAFIGKDYGKITTIPQGLALHAEFARYLIQQQKLGYNPHGAPDMLALSFSSTDLIGHAYGPHSVEIEDTYLRLDKILGDFLDFLDNYIGKDQYLLFLTADHGVSPVPDYLKEHKIAAEAMDIATMKQQLDSTLRQQFKTKKLSLISATANNQIYLNEKTLQILKIERQAAEQAILTYCRQHPGVLAAFATRTYPNEQFLLPEVIKQRYQNSFHINNSGDIQIIFKSHHLDGWFFQDAQGRKAKGTTHGSWYNYDAHIPLIFYGSGILPGASYERYFMTDIAPTICTFLRINPPSGSIGAVITELLPQWLLNNE